MPTGWGWPCTWTAPGSATRRRRWGAARGGHHRRRRRRPRPWRNEEWSHARRGVVVVDSDRRHGRGHGVSPQVVDAAGVEDAVRLRPTDRPVRRRPVAAQRSHANAMATPTGGAVATSRGCTSCIRSRPTESSPRSRRVRSRHSRSSSPSTSGMQPTHVVRWMCSWDTTSEDVDGFAERSARRWAPPEPYLGALLRALLAAHGLHRDGHHDHDDDDAHREQARYVGDAQSGEIHPVRIGTHNLERRSTGDTVRVWHSRVRSPSSPVQVRGSDAQSPSRSPQKACTSPIARTAADVEEVAGACVDHGVRALALVGDVADGSSCRRQSRRSRPSWAHRPADQQRRSNGVVGGPGAVGVRPRRTGGLGSRPTCAARTSSPATSSREWSSGATGGSSA